MQKTRADNVENKSRQCRKQEQTMQKTFLNKLRKFRNSISKNTNKHCIYIFSMQSMSKREQSHFKHTIYVSTTTHCDNSMISLTVIYIVFFLINHIINIVYFLFTLLSIFRKYNYGVNCVFCNICNGRRLSKLFNLGEDCLSCLTCVIQYVMGEDCLSCLTWEKTV